MIDRVIALIDFATLERHEVMTDLHLILIESIFGATRWFLTWGDTHPWDLLVFLESRRTGVRTVSDSTDLDFADPWK